MKNVIIDYIGSKSRAIRILDKFIPANTKHICSPFFGGGTFEIHCATQRGIKVSAADVFEPLVNFWQCLQKDAPAVLQRVMQLKGRMNKAKHDRFEQILLQPGRFTQQQQIVRAALFYIVNRTSWGGKIGLNSYMHRNSTTRSSLESKKSLAKLVQVDFRNITFALRDFRKSLEICKSSTGTVFFLDPPYYLGKQAYYGKNGELHKKFPHEELHKILTSATFQKRKWVLCYNNCPYIRNLYKGCKMVQTNWAHASIREQNNKKVKKELIVLSDALQDELRA